MPDPLVELPWWGYVLVALTFTHTTIAAVTIYLHRHQAHMALSLHPIVSHFFRFWLWLSTAMVTKEWIAVHRKHHARVETRDDPHSPQIYGIHRVLWLGAYLYRKEARRRDTLETYGYGAPTDWLERNIYTPMTFYGPALMLIMNTVLFGAVAGLAIWATQMAWIPFWAAGVINGVGHYLGYRNYDLPDASRNIVPFGLIIGGEELHNNHHAYASSAKFSSRPWEVDLGWIYIRLLHRLGLARVKKVAPKLVVASNKRHCDIETARAVLGNRFQVMANFVGEVLRAVCREEMRRTPPDDKEQWQLLRRARKLMVRDKSRLDETNRAHLDELLRLSPRLRTVYAMKQRLQAIWSRSAASHEALVASLEEWCRAAEESGIEALREFSRRLRSYSLAYSLPR